MKKKWYILMVMMLVSMIGYAQNDRTIPYSQSDRDRSIRMEERQNTLDAKIESLRQEMNANFVTIDKRFEAIDKRFEAVDKRFESVETSFDKRFNVLENLMYVIIAGIFGLIGFVAYDRRRANEPLREELKREHEELEKLRKEVEKNKRFREALKEVPSLQEALKQVGLL